MKTPFLGQSYVDRSTNLAANQCINLYPSLADGGAGQAKDIAAFYMDPGLDLLVTVGVGPIRGEHVLNDNLYAVSGNEVYLISSAYATQLLGTLTTGSGPVSMIDNGKQLAIFDGVAETLTPGGQPLTGGTIGSAGTLYAIGDTIVLQNTDGAQNATAVIEVTSVSGAGGVTGFTIVQTGAFGTPPSAALTQQTSDGSGTGFSLSGLTVGTYSGLYVVPLPFNGPVSASYQDGFGLVNETGTNIWWQSNLFDLSYWNPLNFSSADAQPDDVVALADLHREVFLFKENETEVWINAGSAGFSFQRLQGVLIQQGCVAPFSVARSGDILTWVGRSQEGQGVVYAITGYEAKPISTNAIATAIQSYSKISDAVGYTYQQNGHSFYVIRFPSGNATWVCDLTMSPPQWHQKAALNNGQFEQHWATCHALFNGIHVVGDYRNGSLYNMNMDARLDNGAQRKWLRSWRALPAPQFEPVTFSQLQIDMQTGVGVPDDGNPQVTLRWSDDGAHNWSNERYQSAGKTGETALRVTFKRLGSTRLNSGLDRIFELSSSDQFDVALIGADLT